MPLVRMPSYVGRFAPTPSGALHFGSLVTALASFLDARAAKGHWLLRFDDLDQPRVKAGAIDLICAQLHAHGLHWDDEPRYQSRHLARYEEALQRLEQQGVVYACTCSRTRLQALGTVAQDLDEIVYPGYCREAEHGDQNAALRVRLPAGPLEYVDRLRGVERRRVPEELGDFVVRRKDGLVSYQLACAVDEHEQGITHVVRGRDLISSTLRQRWLTMQLGYHVPAHLHLPLVVDDQGRKLSKRSEDDAIDGRLATDNLLHALDCLGQSLPPPAFRSKVVSILAHAITNWNPATISHDTVRMR